MKAGPISTSRAGSAWCRWCDLVGAGFTPALLRVAVRLVGTVRRAPTILFCIVHQVRCFHFESSPPNGRTAVRPYKDAVRCFSVLSRYLS